jgi:hypothetical protein
LKPVFGVLCHRLGKGLNRAKAGEHSGQSRPELVEEMNIGMTVKRIREKLEEMHNDFR